MREPQQGNHTMSDTFRKEYRQLSPEISSRILDIKAAAEDMEIQLLRLEAGRHRSLAITALEESVLWAVKQATT
jgi:hypothetical protein